MKIANRVFIQQMHVTLTRQMCSVSEDREIICVTPTKCQARHIVLCNPEFSTIVYCSGDPGRERSLTYPESHRNACLFRKEWQPVWWGQG